MRVETLYEVKELSQDPTVRWELLEKLGRVPNFLAGDNKPGLFEATKIFDKKNFFIEVGDVGLIAAMNITVGLSADVHVTFWDGHLRGKETVCRRVAADLMYMFELLYLTTKIEVRRRTVIAFAKRLGFMEYRRDEEFVYLKLDNDCLHGANSTTGRVE